MIRIAQLVTSMHRKRALFDTATCVQADNKTGSVLLSRREIALAGIGMAAALLPSTSRAWDGPLMDLIEGSEDFITASDAYIYGYPLVTMEITRRVVSNVPKPEGTRAPMGTLIKLRE